jgi:hypothetical protein
MPYKSQAQRALFYAKEARGELPKGTAERWQEETGKRKLPEYVKEAQKRALGKLAKKGQS